MKKTLILAFWQLCFLSLLISCSEKQTDTNESIQLKQGQWGHLQHTQNPYAKSLFLANFDNNQTYHLCVEDSLDFTAEIKAALQIWGESVGKKIQVQIHRERFLHITKGLDLEEETKQVKKSICPKETHLIVGIAPLNNQATGITLYRKEANGEIIHGLYLNQNKSWLSLANLDNKTYSSDQILKILKSRNQYRFPPSGYFLTLSTLMHEFGHVWGLCDQYHEARNCIDYANFDNESIMAEEKPLHKLYLTDDDIEGLSKLVQTPPSQNSFIVPHAPIYVNLMFTHKKAQSIIIHTYLQIGMDFKLSILKNGSSQFKTVGGLKLASQNSGINAPIPSFETLKSIRLRFANKYGDSYSCDFQVQDQSFTNCSIGIQPYFKSF